MATESKARYTLTARVHGPCPPAVVYTQLKAGPRVNTGRQHGRARPRGVKTRHGVQLLILSCSVHAGRKINRRRSVWCVRSLAMNRDHNHWSGTARRSASTPQTRKNRHSNTIQLSIRAVNVGGASRRQGRRGFCSRREHLFPCF